MSDSTIRPTDGRSYDGPTDDSILELVRVATASATQTELLRSEVRVVEKRDKHMKILMGMVLASMALLIVIAALNRQGNARIVSCTTPNGDCWRELRQNPEGSEVVRQLLNEEIENGNLIRQQQGIPLKPTIPPPTTEVVK